MFNRRTKQVTFRKWLTALFLTCGFLFSSSTSAQTEGSNTPENKNIRNNFFTKTIISLSQPTNASTPSSPAVRTIQKGDFLITSATKNNTAIDISPPPADPPPKNKTKPGGGLTSVRKSCRNSERELTALVPVKNPVLTTSSHPKLLVYIPDRSEDINKGEFWINTQDERTRIYEKVEFNLTDTPGIVSISLPQVAESALEKDKYYHWYLKIYCQDSNNSNPDIEVDGWFGVVPSTTNSQQLIEAGNIAIWYDSAAHTYDRLRSTPNDTKLKQQWWELLNVLEAESDREISAENLAEQPLLGEVKLKAMP